MTNGAVEVAVHATNATGGSGSNLCGHGSLGGVPAAL
jgi:hypothetical protein